MTAFIVTLLLTTHFGSVVTAQEAPQEQAQGEERIAFTMRHTTSWFGDTADAGAGAWVQGTINAMWVDEDGSVYTNSIWDEDAREAGVYRDGQVVGRLPGLHGTGGYAVTGDDAHIYVAATLDGGYAVRRFNKSDYSASPFEGGEGPSGDGLVVSERGHIRGLAYHHGELFASDTDGDRIRVYDAATMTHKRDLPISRPGPLSVGEDGALWVVEEVIDREIAEDGTLTVAGAGSDIWDSADGFYYLYRQVTGDAVLSARVARQENTHAWAKAGVMVRETLDPGSPHTLMALTPGNGSTFIWRAAAGEGSQSSTPGDGARAPYWVRLERRGDTLTGYVSEDGSEGSWTEVGEAALGLAEEVYLGLAVSSHSEGALSSVEFDNVGDLASWQGQDIGNARDGEAFSGRVTSTTTTRTIRKLALDGELQDARITDVVNPAALAVDNEGRLLVAEDGPRQQILIYDVSGAPELVGTLGEEGGIYAGEPGRYGDLKLNGPVGI
ncbi:MAG: DUF1349 domain-containing protein, partial [Deinococcota bacterium]|nr:DUF1349 domain-containing protein [Deinococcota bacterium]